MRLQRGFGWDALTIATNRFSVRAAQFCTSIIVARVLGPEGRGLVSSLSVPSQLAVNFSEMGIRQATAFFLGRGIFSIERLLPTLLTLIPLAGGLAIALSIGYFELARVAEDDWLLRGLAVAIIPLLLTTSYATGVFLGRQRIAAFRRASWRPAFANLLLVALLCWGLSVGVYGVQLASLGAASLGCAYALYLLSKEGKLRFGFDREVAKSLQRKGISFALTLFVVMLNYRIMILLLTRFSTLDQVGLYAQAVAIAELIWEVPTAVSSLLMSRGVNAKKQDEFSRKVLVLARFAFLAAVGISILLALIAPYLFPLLYGRKFAASAHICILLLPGVVAFIVFKVLNTDMASRGNPWVAMMVMLPTLLCNIVLGWWMITHYDAIGAAYAASIGYIMAAIGYLILYSRETKIGILDMVTFKRSDFELLMRSLPFSRK